MAKGDGAGGHNIDRALYAPENRRSLGDKLGMPVIVVGAQDGCVPSQTPCGACDGCRRRAAARVLGEALEDQAHAPWPLSEAEQVLCALGLKAAPVPEDTEAA